MKKGKRLSIITLIVILSIALLGISCTKKDSSEIKIGVISPLTGPAASFGVSQKNGSDLGIDEINSKGGINGKKILAIYEDSQLDPNKAITAFKKLTDVDKVSVVVAQGSTSEVLAIAPLAEKAKVILIAPGASGAKITDAGDYTFRISPSDAFQGGIASEYATKKGYKKVAIIYVNNDWGNGLKEGFEKAYKRTGGEVILSESMDSSAKDFRTPLTKIKSANPDMVYIPIHPDQAGILLRQAKELGVKTQFFGTDSFSEKAILSVAGNAAEGVIFTMPAKTAGPSFEEFAKNYKTKYNTDASYIAAAAYDAIIVISKALTIGKGDAAGVKNALYNIKGHSGASGDITFDSNGDVTNKKFDLLMVRKGDYVPLME